MKRLKKKAQPPAGAPSDIELGRISHGPYDSQLGPEPKPVTTRHRKSARRPRDVSDATKPPPAPAAKPISDSSESLALPRGAWVAVRKSGGLRFTSRELMVYGDGRVTYAGDDTAGQLRAWKMTDTQASKLRDTLDAIDFSHLPPTAGRQNPDAYVYEIVARVRRRVRHVETFDGSIPDSLKPFIRQLGRLIPPQD